MQWKTSLINRIGRASLLAAAALVLTVGCRSTKTDRIRYLEAENAKLAAENSSLSDDLASEKSAKYREAEARERAEAESLQKDATILALAQQRRTLGEDLKDTRGLDVEGNVIRMSSDITFQPGQATLTPQAEKVLAEVARAVQKRQLKGIRIEGHTDSDPIKRSGWGSNQELSLARAESVRKTLANKGIELTLMQTIGLGDTKPRATNETAAGKAQNRRVEIVLIEP